MKEISVPVGRTRVRITNIIKGSLLNDGDEGYIDGYVGDEDGDVLCIFVRIKDGCMIPVSLCYVKSY